MKPLRTRLQESRKRLGLPWDVLERDYLLSWMLAGISQVDALRALLQHLRALERRGWVRSRARDYYDLWRILGEHRGQLDWKGFPTFLHEKCEIREVTFTGPESFFPPSMLAVVEKTWDQWLGPLVPNLPSYTMVINDLRPQIAALLTQRTRQ